MKISTQFNIKVINTYSIIPLIDIFILNEISRGRTGLNIKESFSYTIKLESAERTISGALCHNNKGWFPDR